MVLGLRVRLLRRCGLGRLVAMQIRLGDQVRLLLHGGYVVTVSKVRRKAVEVIVGGTVWAYRLSNVAKVQQ